jgi:hypothetical protein
VKSRTSTVVPPLLALALGACAADAPTAPRALPASEAAAKAPLLAVQGEPLAALRSAVSDAAGRILPALGDGAAHAPLRAALAAADEALAADDAPALAAALRAARSAAAAERAAMGPDAAAGPDLDALLLVLDGLDTAVPASVAGPAVAEAP